MRLPGSSNNPRWDAWRIAHPEEPSYEFVIWNRRRIAEARRDIPRAFFRGVDGIKDHDAYDEWLFRYTAPYWGA